MPTGAVLGAGALGAGASIFGSSNAAASQEKAAEIAAQTQMAMFRQSSKMLAPYRDLGNQATGALGQNLAYLTSPIQMDQASLEKTPGYQFNLAQGLKATQNSAAARGLGVSGAALKGAAAYATGLADSTYQNQFNNENTNRTNAYNRYQNTATLGENAAAQTGAQAVQTGQGVAQSQTAAGNAQAAGYNAMGAAGSNLANLGGALAYQGMYSNSSGSSNYGGQTYVPGYGGAY